MGNLEGSNGPRRVVQSLWSGAAAAVHRLACPRPVSGPVECNDRVDLAVASGVVTHLVAFKMRPCLARDQLARRARRKMDIVLRDRRADKTVGIRHISADPRIGPRIPDTRR